MISANKALKSMCVQGYNYGFGLMVALLVNDQHSEASSMNAMLDDSVGQKVVKALFLMMLLDVLHLPIVVHVWKEYTI